jgi:DNA N-6-adenine-methyltransferase (Dam)
MINLIDRYDNLCQNSGATRVVLTKETSGNYYTSTSLHVDEWCTPPDIVELVLKVLGEIDLDPCAEDTKNIPARLHYTKIDDSLQREWYGRLFLHPPSSHPEKWIVKLTAELLNGRVSEAIALLPTATDTDWLNSVLKTQPVCFWKERIQFLDANHQTILPATQSYCLVYWGSNQHRFKQVFEQHGVVYLPIWKSDENNQSLNQEVLPVNSTSSTASNVQQISASSELTSSTNLITAPAEQPKMVLPVNSTSSTASNVQQISASSELTSSTNLITAPAEQPKMVLPVNSTSSTALNVEQISASSELTSSTRRRKGKGTGRIHWRTVTKRNGKQYEQPWYDWELNIGKKTISKSTYIPKHLFNIILELEINKAPVNEILSMLGVTV